MLLVSDMPEDHPFISDEVSKFQFGLSRSSIIIAKEKDYIISNRTFDDTKRNEDDVPLLQLLL